MLRIFASLVLLLLVPSGAAVPALADVKCPERPACRGCGCKGGPGYRGPDGRCVGFKNLNEKCGPYPHSGCVFENAPGTGANSYCATH